MFHLPARAELLPWGIELWLGSAVQNGAGGSGALFEPTNKRDAESIIALLHAVSLVESQNPADFVTVLRIFKMLR
jgi:hypothetical protein